MIIFYCHKCGQKGEFERKSDMRCDCGYYANESRKTSDSINMRNTWAKTTQVELSSMSMDQDIAERNNR